MEAGASIRSLNGNRMAAGAATPLNRRGMDGAEALIVALSRSAYRIEAGASTGTALR
jgi:hypothetical protein